MLNRIFLVLSLFLLNACNDSGSDGGQTCSGDICYRVTFNEVWNAANFPTQYPPNSHFSSLIGAVHGPAVDFFEINQAASAGIISMAETGKTASLRAEVNQAITALTALSSIEGGGISNNKSNVSTELEVSDAFPLVTLVSMVAPSPDWFIGVDSLNLKDIDGNFVDRLTINLEVYDAGSDSGVTFTSANSNENGVVSKLSCADLTSHCGFTDGQGSDGVQFIGSFVFEKL